MNKIDMVKGFFAAVFGVLTSVFGALAIPVLLLVACNVIDYATGIGASLFRGQEISSYKGIKGIFKKVCMWILIVVGAIMDELINYTVTQFGFEFQIPFVIACIVAVWLICNELISILENLKDMDAKLPPFLMKIAKNVKSQVESTADVIKEEELEE